MIKPRKPSIRCSSGPFKNNSIIRNIVGRMHVGDPLSDVIDYAKSRLAVGAWAGMSAKDRKAFECEVKKQHAANLALYTQVMRGSSLGRRRRSAR